MALHPTPPTPLPCHAMLPSNGFQVKRKAGADRHRGEIKMGCRGSTYSPGQGCSPAASCLQPRGPLRGPSCQSPGPGTQLCAPTAQKKAWTNTLHALI